MRWNWWKKARSTNWAPLPSTFTALSAYSFLIFNLLCAPCFAAIGAIKREMNNPKWTWFAIGYQTVFAYTIALIVYQLGLLFTGGSFGIGTIAALGASGRLYLAFGSQRICGRNQIRQFD